LLEARAVAVAVTLAVAVAVVREDILGLEEPGAMAPVVGLMLD
jgi:hypothetical protein